MPGEQRVERYDMTAIEGLRHPRPDIAETCAWILGQRRVRAAVPALLAALEARPRDIDVQAAIVTALGRIGDPAAFPALVAVVHSGAVPVRRVALAALWAIDPERARPVLETVLATDPAAGIRAEAARLLGKGVSR
ncbi:HEAT repeat domain-containing protein [Thermomicrobium sp. 4228-Ro]|uniref:HEAT repeat domain-containing protein n=1 Tax=Thermomicrobium sp. 4228-Ro TaxID=2993937 RepID=UPI002248C615|nr:HEAT repeat domain-containing protein [Thermomicrobium sp. 4228-Ro]MCX2728117.1 HEAT repeat domain-containing protein [Thermomicrobium sp. 4228-Ro]